MANTTEKKEYVWVDLARQWEKDRLEGALLIHPRTHHQLRNKFDSMLREARKYNLLLARENGTHGGSGNGREAVESPQEPSFYQHIREKGFLEEPMANKEFVLGGQRGVASLGPSSINTSGDDEGENHADESEIDGWGGEDMPPTTEPIGGRGEAQERAEKRVKRKRSSGEGSDNKKRKSHIESAFRASALTTAEAAMNSTSMLVQCIDRGNDRVNDRMTELWEKDSATQDRRIDRICNTLASGFESLASAIRDSK